MPANCSLKLFLVAALDTDVVRYDRVKKLGKKGQYLKNSYIKFKDRLCIKCHFSIKSCKLNIL